MSILTRVIKDAITLLRDNGGFVSPQEAGEARARLKAGGNYYDPRYYGVGTGGGDTVTTMPIKPPGLRPEFTHDPTIGALPTMEMPTMGPAPTLEMPAAPGMPGGTALPTIDMPEIKTAQFKAPEWSEQAITALSQRKAAPGVRGLKEGLREMTAQTGNDPISRHNSREAMKGYGAGLGQVMAGAHSAAVQEYSQRYGYEFQGAAMQFEAEADAIAMEYRGNLAKGMAEYEGKLRGIMAGYQAKVAGKSMEYQAAMNMMMRQYEVEAQASMLRYETGANRQNLEAQLKLKAAGIDFDAAMQDYMAQYGEVRTSTEGGGWGDTGAGWKPPMGYPGAIQSWFTERTGFGTRQLGQPNRYASPTSRLPTGSGQPTVARPRARSAPVFAPPPSSAGTSYDPYHLEQMIS